MTQPFFLGILSPDDRNKIFQNAADNTSNGATIANHTTELATHDAAIATHTTQIANRTPISARDHGAVGDGTTDDTASIKAALAAVKTNVFLAKLVIGLGTFLISSQILVDFDNCEIDFGGGTLLVNSASPGTSFLPVLVAGDLSNLPPVVRNFSCYNGSIKFANAGPNSLSGLQINNVNGVHVSNMYILGNGSGMANSKTDGLSFALGSTDILVTDVTVDGLSKAGIYLAGCTHFTLDGCIVKNGHESINPITSGLSIGSATDGTIVGCHFHNNRGTGVFVAGEGAVLGSIGTLNSQTSFRLTWNTPFGQWLATNLGIFDTTKKRWEALKVASATVVPSTNNEQYDIVLSSAPVFAMSQGMAVQLQYLPPSRITFSGCTATNNIDASGGSGIQYQLVSASPGAMSTDIVFEGCIGFGGTYGMIINQCAGVEISHCDMSGATVGGLIIQDVGPGTLYQDSTGAENLCTRVTVRGGAYHDCGIANLAIYSANDVIIDSPRISHEAVGSANGILVSKQTVVTSNKPCRNLTILDPQLIGYSSPTQAISSPTDSFASGTPGDASSASYFRLRWPGSPIGLSMPGPAGSQWTNQTTGDVYTKTASGDSTSWARQHTDADGVSLTACVRSNGVGLSLQATAGNFVFLGDPSTNYAAFSPTDFFLGTGVVYLETAVPTTTQSIHTTDLACADMAWIAQTPWASATIHKNGGGFQFILPLPVAGGVSGSFKVTYNSSNMLSASSVGVGFNGSSPFAKPTVTGSRGSNAALASLLTALASYGLIVDGSS